jgi:ferredoxin
MPVTELPVTEKPVIERPAPRRVSLRNPTPAGAPSGCAFSIAGRVRPRQTAAHGKGPAMSAGGGQMPEAKQLKVRVDRDKCQGHNRCKALAPELFELDEYGNAREIGDGTVPAGLEEKAYLAKANCPEFAVEIIES